jgi:hypothetical protein
MVVRQLAKGLNRDSGHWCAVDESGHADEVDLGFPPVELGYRFAHGGDISLSD